MGTVSKTIHISDTVHGSIPISYLEKRIISTRIFNRLHNISQNSTAYLTYPTNRTKRFEHSVGTMHLCSQMFMYGINNADEGVIDSFFDDLSEEINSILETKLSGEGDQIYRTKLDDVNFRKRILFSYDENIKINDYIYRLNIPKQILDKKLEVPYVLLFQAIRLAAMLHDVGHPPMSHIAENALETIWEKIKPKKDRNEREKEFYECIKYYYDSGKDKFVLHERISVRLSRRLLEHSIEQYNNSKDKDLLYKTLFELIVMDMTIGILEETTPFLKWVHRIIDGSLDGDRLDYVTRDPINSGIDTGKIEYDRLLSTMRLIKYNDGSYWICPHIKMIDIVDDFFYRRWMMYKKIIFHHRVVKTDYLMENCIEKIADDYFTKNIVEDLSVTSKDISYDNILPYDISGVWKGAKGQASHEGFFDTILQWDDSWLLTVLKKHFYNDYKTIHGNHDSEDNAKIYYKLEELISNKKSYYSLLKKDADLLLLDEFIAEKIAKRSEKILSLINELKELEVSDKNVKQSDKVGLKINPFLEVLEFFLRYVDNRHKTGVSSGNYILSVFRFEISTLFPDEMVYNRIIEKSLKETLLNNDYIEEWFYHIKKVKTGINQNLMLYSEDGNKDIGIHIYEQISDTNFILERRRNSLIPVYIYLRKKDIKTRVDFVSITKELGNNMGDKICDEIESYIDNLIRNKEGVM